MFNGQGCRTSSPHAATSIGCLAIRTTGMPAPVVRLAVLVMGNLWGLTARLYVDLRLQAGCGCLR